MEKEYISTIVIDSESAVKDWRELPTGKQDEDDSGGNQNTDDSQPEFSGVTTWVS